MAAGYWQARHCENLRLISYKSGCVVSLGLDEDTWKATVSGHEDYGVTVTLDGKGNVTETACGCPYDWGPYCNQAAVLYAIRSHGTVIPNAKKNDKKQKIDGLLVNIPAEQLCAFVAEYAQRDGDFANALNVRFATPDFSAEVQKTKDGQLKLAS
jgi:uncharacterized Zn finger protein